MTISLHLTDGQVFTSAKACIYDPSVYAECGEYRLADEAARWCAETSIVIVVVHWPDDSCELQFATEADRLVFCIRWNLVWALDRS
jgi:hypothetical protein